MSQQMTSPNIRSKETTELIFAAIAKAQRELAQAQTEDARRHAQWQLDIYKEMLKS